MRFARKFMILCNDFARFYNLRSFLPTRFVVGVAGFKPTTSPTPRVRANQAALYSVIYYEKFKAEIIS